MNARQGERYRQISEAIRPAKDPRPTPHARRRVEAYSTATFAAFLVFDQTVRQHLGDRRTSPQRSFQVRRKAARRSCELVQLSHMATWGQLLPNPDRLSAGQGKSVHPSVSSSGTLATFGAHFQQGAGGSYFFLVALFAFAAAFSAFAAE